MEALVCLNLLKKFLKECPKAEIAVRAGAAPATSRQAMLIAGDIGATTTRLALVSPEAGPRKFVAEQNFPSSGCKGLQPIVEAFLAATGGYATSACFHLTSLAQGR